MTASDQEQAPLDLAALESRAKVHLAGYASRAEVTLLAEGVLALVTVLKASQQQYQIACDLVEQVEAERDAAVAYNEGKSARIQALESELENERKFNTEVQCSYCGQVYPRDGDGTLIAIDQHINECELHPMSKLRDDLARVEAERDAAYETAQQHQATADYDMGFYNGVESADRKWDEAQARITELEADLRYARESWSLVDQKLSAVETERDALEQELSELERDERASTNASQSKSNKRDMGSPAQVRLQARIAELEGSLREVVGAVIGERHGTFEAYIVDGPTFERARANLA